MKRHYELADPSPKSPSREKRPKTVTGKGWTYRVGWQRRDRETGALLRPKYKHFFTLTAAERFWRLFGPAPWRYFRSPMDPTDRWPCRAAECERGKVTLKRRDWNIPVGSIGAEWFEEVDCSKCYGGTTVRDWIFRRRLELPEIEWIRIERRPVGAWQRVEAAWQGEVDSALIGATSGRTESSAARFLREALSEDPTAEVVLPERQPRSIPF